MESTALGPLIRNAEATLYEIQTGNAVLPVIVPDPDPAIDQRERCAMTCMESAAIGCFIDEMRKLHGLSGPRLAVVRALGRLFSIGPWRRAVQVGSLPFTLTLRSPETGEALWRLLPELREQMPDRPFIVRNILDGNIPEDLPSDAAVLPAWIDYCWDFSHGEMPRKEGFVRDRKRFLSSGLLIIEDGDFDDGRIVEALNLYDLVYRQRHGLRNPDYTPEFIALGRSRGWLRLRGLVDPETGKLLAFADLASVNGTMTQALIGYDVRADRRERLYSHLMAMSGEYALAHRMELNLTCGAGEFKRRRGYLPRLEHYVVFPALKGSRRASDRLLIAMASRLGRELTVERMIAGGA